MHTISCPLNEIILFSKSETDWIQEYCYVNECKVLGLLDTLTEEQCQLFFRKCTDTKFLLSKVLKEHIDLSEKWTVAIRHKKAQHFKHNRFYDTYEVKGDNSNIKLSVSNEGIIVDGNHHVSWEELFRIYDMIQKKKVRNF